jgi:hypothetical protein
MRWQRNLGNVSDGRLGFDDGAESRGWEAGAN